ncbi:MAG: polyphosphate kinase 1 [Planctomycetota bacterium]|nr:polyphosphate kinase 1 [Planctomycetota bacterium]
MPATNDPSVPPEGPAQGPGDASSPPEPTPAASPPAEEPEPEPDLSAPEYYLPRELSLLEFQRRVLAQSQDTTVPLLERLRFLVITATNLDEFFEIRVSGLKQRIHYGAGGVDVSGSTSQETLHDVTTKARRLIREQYRILNQELLPALEEEGIQLLRREEWTEPQARWIRSYFDEQVLPVLSPIGLDPAHPFPKTLGKSLNFIVELEGKDGFGRHIPMAIVQVARSLPRLIALPKKLSPDKESFVLLSSIVHAHVEELFRGLTVLGCHQFRVTRDSDLWVDPEEVQDLLHALRGELSSRHYSAAVRLEVSDKCPAKISNFLLERFEMHPGDLYRVDGPVNLYRLAALIDVVDRPDLKYSSFLPGLPRRLVKGDGDLFEVLRTGNVLLHHPYQSFQPVLEFLERAATDPAVLAIKMTLYRTGSDSPVVKSLVRAAQAGKDVTCVVELRARFDEAANIDLATRLQEVGAKVVYGIVGFKTHSKMLMVVRREGRKLRRYCHLGTGNYHAGTARLYTDIGLLTADERIGEDMQKLFLQLTGTGSKVRLKKLLASPFSLRKTLIRLIDAEAEHARRGEPAHIRIKVNSINEPKVIQALYRASQAGVKIEMVVRGICCVRPGVKGVSENIRVRSIVGRFLEHSRAYCFHAGGEDLVYMGSADLLGRNLHGRVEVVFPIEDRRHKRRILREVFGVHEELSGDSWSLRSDGSWRRVTQERGHQRSGQHQLLMKLAESS